MLYHFVYKKSHVAIVKITSWQKRIRKSPLKFYKLIIVGFPSAVKNFICYRKCGNCLLFYVTLWHMNVRVLVPRINIHQVIEHQGYPKRIGPIWQERQRGWTNKGSVPFISGIDLNEAFALPRMMRKRLYINIDIWKKHKNFKCLQSGRRIAILLGYNLPSISKNGGLLYIL